jgi:hypothetical protein
MTKADDRADYEAAIAELGYTEEQVQVEVQNYKDIADMPKPAPGTHYKVEMRLSPIHGHGMFATSTINKGEVIGPARINDDATGKGYRTMLGRWVNHSAHPNTTMRYNAESGMAYLVAINTIVGQTGGLPGQEITIDYREAKRVAAIADDSLGLLKIYKEYKENKEVVL